MATKRPGKRREVFDALRAKYRSAKATLDDADIALHVKYGRNFQDSWLSRAEAKALASAKAAVDKAGKKFFDHLQSFSPRDWSYGVPIHWLYEDLTYEDAARPTTERLSVVPVLVGLNGAASMSAARPTCGGTLLFETIGSMLVKRVVGPGLEPTYSYRCSRCGASGMLRERRSGAPLRKLRGAREGNLAGDAQSDVAGCRGRRVVAGRSPEEARR